jgi:uncharacterized protein (TIGR03067 family)
MRMKLLAIAAALVLVAADAADEAKKLQGDWKVVAAEAGGMKVDDKLKDAYLIVKGDKFIMADKGKGKENKELVFKIDPNKKPKQLDLTDPTRPNVPSIPCIYSLEGDQLKVCIPLVEKGKKTDLKRPESFDTKDKPLMTFTAKRAKP